GNANRSSKAFYTEGTAAMTIVTSDFSSSWPINWDIAKAPVFSDLPGVGSSIHGAILTIANTSKQKDEAFQLISYMSSEEKFLENTRRGQLSTWNNPKARDEFGQNLDWLKGKKLNVGAMFPDKFAAPYTATRYDSFAQSALVRNIDKLASGAISDVNTALRTAAAEADEAITAQIGK
ncbi:MAG: hypothetical protein K0Q59_2041, partial [Paenibacillus sp.]|nr:hypothetical protein [Paenibacillus sp.]